MPSFQQIIFLGFGFADPALHFNHSIISILIAFLLYFYCISAFCGADRTLIGEKSRNPRGIYMAFPKLQKNCEETAHFSAKLYAKSAGDERVVGSAAGRVSEGDGVIIVDHGSRRQESNLMLNEFVAMFRDRTGYSIVEPAHMELAQPSIRDAFCSCVKQGAKRVIVSPFFLSPGRHWQQDIPSLADEAAKNHAGISYIVTAPLGLHELLVDVLNDRIQHCLQHAVGEADECKVCAGTGKCRIY